MLPLPEGLILELGGVSVLKAGTALRITEWANQYLVTTVFSMLIRINTGKNRKGGSLLKILQLGLLGCGLES